MTTLSPEQAGGEPSPGSDAAIDATGGLSMNPIRRDWPALLFLVAIVLGALLCPDVTL